MTEKKPESKNLKDNLKRLSEITKWFDNQEEVDVEAGLDKVKEAVGLIKTSKKRLQDIENEFKEIKKEIDLKEVEDTQGTGEGIEEESAADDMSFSR